MEVADNTVRNNECTLSIATGRGRTWTYRRDKDGWTQTGPTGSIHRMTAEQLLSHILPPLAAVSKSRVSVSVVPDPVGHKRKPLTRKTRSGKPSKH